MIMLQGNKYASSRTCLVSKSAFSYHLNINREASATNVPRASTHFLIQYFLSRKYGFTEYQILLVVVQLPIKQNFCFSSMLHPCSLHFLSVNFMNLFLNTCELYLTIQPFIHHTLPWTLHTLSIQMDVTQDFLLSAMQVELVFTYQNFTWLWQKSKFNTLPFCY